MKLINKVQIELGQLISSCVTAAVHDPENSDASIARFALNSAENIILKVKEDLKKDETPGGEPDKYPCGCYDVADVKGHLHRVQCSPCMIKEFKRV